MSPTQYLPPRLLQGIGLVLLIVFSVFWALTGRESILLVGAAGSLILLGGYGRAIRSIIELSEAPRGGGETPREGFKMPPATSVETTPQSPDQPQGGG